jgi:hypothetical protein
VPADAIDGLGCALEHLLVEQDAECADLYEYGMDDTAMSRSGMNLLCGLDDRVVIPNYFEPFCQENATIRFAYKLRDGQRALIFKADCDQDRPNQLE